MPYANIEDRRNYEKRYRKDHPEWERNKKAHWRRTDSAMKQVKELKAEVLTHYGGGELACVECGFNDIRALSVDHINGGGYQHYKDLKRRGIFMYRWLKNENFPSGYQTLCMNCQFIKREEQKEWGKHKEVIC